MPSVEAEFRSHHDFRDGLLESVCDRPHLRREVPPSRKTHDLHQLLVRPGRDIDVRILIIDHVVVVTDWNDVPGGQYSPGIRGIRERSGEVVKDILATGLADTFRLDLRDQQLGETQLKRVALAVHVQAHEPEDRQARQNVRENITDVF